MSKVKAGLNWPLEVTKKDLEITYFRGPGPGGQKRNKTSNACRIKHIPTGHTTQAVEHRSQEQNRLAAFKKLTDILVPIMKKEAQKERYSAPEEEVRVYKEKPDMVIDKRVKDKVFSYKDILDGDLDSIIDNISISNTKED